MIALTGTLTGLSLTACYDQETEPIREEDAPLTVILNDLEGGTYESKDDYDFKITFDGGVDEIKNEKGEIIAGSPEGTRGPWHKDLTISFELKDAEGVTLGTNVVVDKIEYVNPEDECDDKEAALTTNDGVSGSFILPSGVEEVKAVLALADSVIDNDLVDSEERKFVFEITGLEGASANEVTLSINTEFEFVFLDDEDIYTEWVLDHEDSSQFAGFIALFSPINSELEELVADSVDEIKLEFEFEEMKAAIKLKREELVEECGESEMDNVEIEVKGEFEVEDGEVEIDFENEDEDEFKYKGTYSITQGNPNTLTITLKGEDEDEETVVEETTIVLERD